jgi:hypothetical protein
MTSGNDAPDRAAAESALLELVSLVARCASRSATMRSGRLRDDSRLPLGS